MSGQVKSLKDLGELVERLQEGKQQPTETDIAMVVERVDY